MCATNHSGTFFAKRLLATIMCATNNSTEYINVLQEQDTVVTIICVTSCSGNSIMCVRNHSSNSYVCYKQQWQHYYVCYKPQW